MGNQQSLTTKQYEAHKAKIELRKEVCDGSVNAKHIEKYFRAFNWRNTRVNLNYLSENATFSFKGADACMPLELHVEQVLQIEDSFPDLYVSWDKIYEREPGVVVVQDFYSHGTHTGKPFAFGPLPAIPATGKEVHEGPSQFVFIMEKGKIIHCEVECPASDITGPPGYYVKIGGKLEAA